MDPDPAPGGGGSPAAFDPGAFKTEMMAEFNKAMNGFGKTIKGDIAKLFKDAKPTEPPPDGGDPPPGDPPKPNDPPKPGDPPKPHSAVDPEKNALMQEIRKVRGES